MSARVSRRRALGRIVLAGLAPAIAGGCSDDDSTGETERTGERDREPDPTDSPASSPEPGNPAGKGHSPFTGRRVGARGPVLAVKIDNLAAARPHRGVEAADLVYVEPVEAGLSRLMAVFSSSFPERIGPVRSARESDIEILRPFGRPGFVFSGANEVVLSLLADARPIGLSPDQVGQAYMRSSDRSAPHNLYLDPREVLDAEPAAEVSVAKDIGFRFGQPPPGGRPAKATTVSYPAFELSILPDRSVGRWRLAMDGEPYAASPSTVVIQRVRQRASEYGRLRAYGSQFLVTTGEGEATVLRDGRAYPARWSRSTPADGTTFRDEGGNVIDFTRGQVWVIYDVL